MDAADNTTLTGTNTTPQWAINHLAETCLSEPHKQKQQVMATLPGYIVWVWGVHLVGQMWCSAAMPFVGLQRQL